MPIHDLPYPEISTQFQQLAQSSESYEFIIPIGFPNSGKSMLMASLLWYAKNGRNPYFTTQKISYGVFQEGANEADRMESLFVGSDWVKSTNVGSINLIGIQFNPINQKKFINLNFAFVDFSGEDIQTIKMSDGGQAALKMSAVLHGLEAGRAKVTFLILTPYYLQDFSLQTREDGLMVDFLSYVDQKHPNLDCDKFIFVTKWDQNGNSNLPPEEYIRINRPGTFQQVNNSGIVWGSYSIGRVQTYKENGIDKSAILSRDTDYPLLLWKAFYENITGRSLDYKTFWERLFS